MQGQIGCEALDLVSHKVMFASKAFDVVGMEISSRGKQPPLERRKRDIDERGVESVKAGTFEIDEEYIHTYIHHQEELCF